jgi:precorrin-3B C17-methyltransferase
MLYKPKCQGTIYLVGLGPGDPAYLNPGGAAALRDCDVVVGFRGYIEMAGNLLQGKELVSMELGQELERAAKAVDIAYEGKSVAVVSSGDPGIYGMSGPVFQVLTDRDWDGENPRIESLPGITAMQAAAALLGSPLMQDFCAISLSDLMTPWDTIKLRLESAAKGDFVVSLYNPRSQRRQWQLLEARRILLDHRPGGTPVGIVGDAFRPKQRVTVTDLEHLEEASPDIDMVTTVVIGNSTTYLHRGRVITPRGYEKKEARPA